MYHFVGEPQAGEKPRNVVPAEAFRAQLGCFAERGFETISPDALAAALGGGPGARLPGKPLLISFDDVDFRRMDEALAILGEFGYGATGYLIASRGEDFPSRERAAELRAAKFELGSHALSHGRLTGLSDDESRREVFESRRIIEERLGGECRHLAYPHGSFGPREEDLCRQAGYLTALSTRRGNRHGGGEAFRLRRLAMRPDTDAARIARYLGWLWHIEHDLKERLGLESRGGPRGK
jgi:peptidoglycan/xylan/chitin deacetylase (PgdA/CDA1 family)